MAKRVARRAAPQAQSVIPDHSDAPMVMVDVDSIIPWDDNPHQNDEAAKRLAVLIQAHGFINPVIIWSRNGVMYAGHARIKAAKLLGITQVPARLINFASEEMAIAYGLADNRANEWSVWDETALVKNLNKLEHVGIPEVARITGFEQEEIEGIGKWLEPPEKEPTEPSGPRAVVCPHCGREILVE